MSLVLGLFGLLAGAAIALLGLRLYLVMLPLSGFLAGFLLGGGFVAAMFGGGFLATTFGLVIGIVAGAVFALASYFYWYLAVLAAVGVAGFVFGASLFGTFGVSVEWLLFLLALAVGIGFFLIALTIDLPVYLVVWSTAILGSAIAIGSLLVIFGQLDPATLSSGGAWLAIRQNWLLWILWVVGAGAGMAVQLQSLSTVKLPGERWASLASGQNQSTANG